MGMIRCQAESLDKFVTRPEPTPSSEWHILACLFCKLFRSVWSRMTRLAVRLGEKSCLLVAMSTDAIMALTREK
jgi:hypothetical protein